MTPRQAVAGAVFNGHLMSSDAASVLLERSGSSFNLRALSSLQPMTLRLELLHVVSAAIQVR